MNEQNPVQDLLEAVKANIIKLQSDKGLKASGKSALSLHVETTPPSPPYVGGETGGVVLRGNCSAIVTHRAGRSRKPAPAHQGLYDLVAIEDGISYA